MKRRGVPCVDSLDKVPDSSLDCILSFHVIEHLPDPLESLSRLKDKLRPGGLLIVEVPHARDILLSGPIASESVQKVHIVESTFITPHERFFASIFISHWTREYSYKKSFSDIRYQITLFWLANNAQVGM
jgi:SAM-dependent methyltransferase